MCPKITFYYTESRTMLQSTGIAMSLGPGTVLKCLDSSIRLHLMALHPTQRHPSNYQMNLTLPLAFNSVATWKVESHVFQNCEVIDG
jgi:hypothetical protein